MKLTSKRQTAIIWLRNEQQYSNSLPETITQLFYAFFVFSVLVKLIRYGVINTF